MRKLLRFIIVISDEGISPLELERPISLTFSSESDTWKKERRLMIFLPQNKESLEQRCVPHLLDDDDSVYQRSSVAAFEHFGDWIQLS
jgi:hypothetical protein